MKVFRFNNENFDGLFHYFRTNKPPLISYVKTSSYNTYYSASLCSKKYSSNAAFSIIDGNVSSCWSNLNSEAINEQEVIIDIGTNKFQLKTLILATPCASPQKMEVLGSNDGNIYSRICLLKDFQKDYSTTNNTCDSGNSRYRIFKIKQNVNNEGRYRLHIAEIEFYGILYPESIQTCQNSDKFRIIYIMCMMIIK